MVQKPKNKIIGPYLEYFMFGLHVMIHIIPAFSADCEETDPDSPGLPPTGGLPQVEGVSVLQVCDQSGGPRAEEVWGVLSGSSSPH